MSVYQIGKGLPKYIGLSTDTKPTAADPQNLQYPEVGSTYLEGDTGKLFVTYDRTNWGVKAETVEIAAGTNIIGKVGIDQTTPGMTNGVRVTFGGAVYRNSDVAVADTARRFETTAKKLRNVTILVSGKAQLFGDDSTQDYPVNPGDTLAYDYIDISTLYFKNAAAGENGTVYILGVEE